MEGQQKYEAEPHPMPADLWWQITIGVFGFGSVIMSTGLVLMLQNEGVFFGVGSLAAVGGTGIMALAIRNAAEVFLSRGDGQ